MDQVNINAESVGEFSSFQDWVNRAGLVFKFVRKTRHDILLCVDSAGNSCIVGEDFMHARDNDLFPVKAYRVARSIEHHKYPNGHTLP